jgi:homoserine dehydrogenase
MRVTDGNATGSAVLSDISALTYDYRYEYKKLNQPLNHTFTRDIELELFVSYNDVIKPNPGDFVSISVKHESSGFNYVIGKITLLKLMNTAWL